MKSFKSRRLVSVLTVICMIALLLVPMGVSAETADVTAATSGNLLTNPNFDTDATGWNLDDSVAYSATGGEHGSGSVKISSAWKGLYQAVTLEEGKTYSYGFYINGTGVSAKLVFNTNGNPWGGEGKVWEGSSINSQYVKGTYTATETKTHYIYLQGLGGTPVVDSFYIVEGTDLSVLDKRVNLITNPDVDTDSTGWTGATHSTSKGEHGSGSLVLSSWGNAYQSVTLKADKTYTYGFYVNDNDSTTVDKARFFIFAPGADIWNNGASYIWEDTDISSQYVTGTFTAASTGNHTFMLKEWGGEHKATYDSFFLIEGTDLSVLDKRVNLITNPDVDTDATGWTLSTNGAEYSATGGEHGLGSIKLPAWENTRQEVTLKANTTYSYGFYLNGTGVSAQFFFQTLYPWNTGGMDNPAWTCSDASSQYVTGTITTTVTGNYYFCIYNTLGTAYYDSFYVVEGTDLSVLDKKVNLITNPDLDTDSTGWTLSEGVYSANGGVSDSGSIKPASWAAASQMVTLKANTSYTFGFYVNGTGVSAKLFVQTANPWNDNANPVWSGSNISSTYVTGTVTAKTTGNYWFFLRDWGGASLGNYDSFYVKELYTGDVNCDTNVADTDDMVVLRKILIGAENAASEITADLTGDGKVDILDLIRIKRYLAKEDVKLGA